MGTAGRCLEVCIARQAVGARSRQKADKTALAARHEDCRSADSDRLAAAADSDWPVAARGQFSRVADTDRPADSVDRAADIEGRVEGTRHLRHVADRIDCSVARAVGGQEAGRTEEVVHQAVAEDCRSDQSAVERQACLCFLSRMNHTS